MTDLISQKSIEEAHVNKKYAILVEYDYETCENWLSFIEWQLNEKVLTQLEEDLSSVVLNIPEKSSGFYLETKALVSEITAREMSDTCITVKHYPKIIEGELQPIDFKFSDDDSNTKKMRKINKILGGNKILNFCQSQKC